MDPVVLPSPEEPAASPSAMPQVQLDLRAGAVVFSRFTLDRLLGQGRCSMTWLAHDTRFHGDVALKVFYNGQPQHSETKNVWQTVLRRLRILNHRHISLPMEYFEDGPWGALNTAYVEGETLAALLENKKDRRLSLSEAEPLLLQIAGALVAAHGETGLVHGNLNAFNIVVDADSDAYVTDFGFFPGSVAANSDPPSWRAKLKTAVVSPERLQNGTPSFTDDIHAFGALCFQTVTGSNPRPDPVSNEAALKSINGLPKNWREAILSALAPSSSRVASMQALLLQLGAPGDTVAERKQLVPRKEPSSAQIAKVTARWKAVVMILGALSLIPILYLVISQHLADTRQLQDDRVKQEAIEKMGGDPEKENLRFLEARLAKAGQRSPAQQVAGQNPPPPISRLPESINTQARAIYTEGLANEKLGDNEAALTSYELAAMLEATWPDLLEARARVLAALGRNEEAIQGYSQVITLVPDRVSSLTARGKLYATMKRQELANADFAAALKAGPDSAAAQKAVQETKQP